MCLILQNGFAVLYPKAIELFQKIYRYMPKLFQSFFFIGKCDFQNSEEKEEEINIYKKSHYFILIIIKRIFSEFVYKVINLLITKAKMFFEFKIGFLIVYNKLYNF